MALAAKPVCARLPVDLDVAIRARAEAEGLSLNELIGAMVGQYVYGETPTVDAGYMTARSMAIKLAHDLVSRVTLEMPTTYDEAVALINQMHQGRWDRRKNPDGG